jgi:hypothetical protein
VDTEVDLSEEQQSKSGRKRCNQDPEESFDLTVENYRISPKRSRRKIADELDVQYLGEVSLIETDVNLQKRNTSKTVNTSTGDFQVDDIAPSQTENSEEIDTSYRKGRRKTKGVKKTPKPKKLSYKKAVAKISTAIPSADLNAQTSIASSTAISSYNNDNYFNYNAASAYDIDLTGECILTDKHSKAPLFEKSSSTVDKNEELKKKMCTSQDIDDIDLDSVKMMVKIKGKIQKFNVRTDQRFYDLFKIIASEQNIPTSSVYLYRNEERIYPDYTPNSIGHKISTIYVCHLLDEKSSVDVKKNKKYKIELKFQSSKWKRPIVLKPSKLESFATILKELCKQIDFKEEQISLKFDGEDVSLTESPIDLEFDGGEILDCYIKE